MDRRRDEINLAALLDGELRDGAQVEALTRELEGDNRLRAEYAAQSEVKELLAGLPEYKAPDFLATRVQGEIAARRGAKAQPRWRPVAAWLSGGAAMLLAFGATVGVRVMQAAPALRADGTASHIPVVQLASQPGMFTEMSYAPQVWDDLPMPEGVNDPQVKDFLTFASEAHEYRKQMRSGERSIPNMPEAVLVLDPGAGGGSPRGLLHFAAEGQ